MQLNDFLSHFEGVKGSGNQYYARCNSHDDKRQSLSIATGDDGRILLTCHAGCKAEDIVASAGLKMQDLFPEKPEAPAKKPRAKTVAYYDYHHGDGAFLAQKVRRDDKSFLWRHRGEDGKWIWKKPPKQLIPPYNLPAIVPADLVYVVEGEKDVETLKAHGIPATTGADGAGPGKWRDHYSPYFQGKDIVVIQDNDDVGRAFALETATALHKVAGRVKLIDLTKALPDLPNHGDVSDLFQIIGDDGAVLAALDALVEDTPAFEPPQQAAQQDEKKERVSQAEILLNLVHENGAEFFHSDAGDPYAIIPVDTHLEVWSLEGRSFRVWLSGLYYERTSKPVNSDAVAQVIATLTAKALFGNLEPITLHTRVAGEGADFWYDLANPSWQAIQIQPEKWQVVDTPPILFHRYGHQAAQVIPTPGGDMTKILEYVPLKEHPVLFFCWLVSAFVPGIPHPMPVFHGEKGAAKSTTCEFLKALIDPSALKTMTLQNDLRTLAVNLQQHWFLPFDNVSFINEETSDTLCRAVTGGGIQQRKLFTNADDTIFTFQRVLAINGINNVATRADLLDRSILIELKRIPEEERRELAALQEAFEQDKAAILGGILDALAEAMRIYPTVSLQRLPRMADFCRWGYAIGEALAKGGGEQFLREYATNREMQNAEAIASDPVATVIVEHMKDRDGWDGTMSELYKALEFIAPEHGINTRSKSFPPDPTRLAKRLNGIRSNLESVGISFERGKNSGIKTISLRRAKIATLEALESKPA